MSQVRLTLNEYAHKVARFRKNDHDTWNENVCHILLGISEEAGEIVGCFKKPLFSNRPDAADFQIDRGEIQKEIGDLIFYLTWLADLFMLDPDEILERNYIKLASRYGYEET